MRCPRCQAENREGRRFCAECGGFFALGCPACGFSNELGEKFCGGCGRLLGAPGRASPSFASPRTYTPKHLAEKILTSRSALEGERKQVTVLFCDLANSTALAERLGPEGMHTLLNRFFELSLAEVHRYEGTVNQFLGDGFMALFGAPIAYEDHARRAVLAALGVRQVVGERRPELGVDLAVRMGLNTGLVVVGSIGDNLRMDYTAVGDTTNLAARLQQLAKPGAILVSEATARLIRRSVRLEPVGVVSVKGKAEPVAASAVLALRPRRSPLEEAGERALSRFVGRERELTMLRERLGLTESGQGQVVGIVGEPGVGKSRLLYEFCRAIAARRVTYLEGRCLSFGSVIPYLPVLDILRSNCGIAEGEPPQAVTVKVRAALEEVGMDAEEGAPYLLQLLGTREGAERLGLLSPETIRGRTMETLRQLSLKGSRRRPLVFAIEDLHWIDRSSEEYLASLVESLAGAPILLLTTYRPGYRPSWMDRSYATQIALPPLAPEESLSVVQSVLQREPLPAPVAHAILKKAEGNPFFLEELARAVVEHPDLGAVAVPDTIQGVLMARIDRLSEAPKRLLQTASVLGREFSLRLLRAVWAWPGEPEPLLAELRRLEFVYEQTGAEEPGYSFKHALTQEVAYDSLLTPHRQALHAAAGRALEGLSPDEKPNGLLAHHFRAAGDLERALDCHARAADAARKVYATREALGHYTAAVEVATLLGRSRGDPVVSRLYLRRGQVSAQSGDIAGARADFETALAGARATGDRTTEMHALDELGFLLAGAADYREAVPRLEAALRMAESLGDGPAQVTILSRLSIVSSNRCEFDRGLEYAHRAIGLARELGDGRALAIAMDSLLLASVPIADFATIDETARQLVEIHRSHGDLWYLQFAFVQWSYVPMGAGRWQEALARVDEALAVNRRIGDRGNEPMYLAFQCWINLSRGEYARALTEGRRAVEVATELGHVEWIAWGETFLGWVLYELGAPAEAVRHLREGLEAAERSGALLHAVNCAGHLAWAHRLAGDEAAARAAANRAEALMSQVRAPAGRAFVVGTPAYVAVARVHLARGDPAGAERVLGPMLVAAEACGWQAAIALASLVIGRCRAARGSREGAESVLRRALAIARGIDLAAVGWETHAVLAGLCRAAGRFDAVERHLGEARAIAERLADGIEDEAVSERFRRHAAAQIAMLAGAGGMSE